MADERINIDFRIIAKEIDRLLTAFKNSTLREWPTKWNGLLGAALLVQGSIRVAATTYDLIRFVCKDKQYYRDPWQKLDFVTAVPPLTRSILDILFALVFLFDDVSTNSERFIQGGWREMCEETERMRREYSSNPKWQQYLGERAGRMEEMRSLRNLPPCGDQALKSFFWPHPGQMRNAVPLSVERKEFLNYLNDWYYKEFSAADHLSFPGLLMRGSPLMWHEDDEAPELKLNVLRSYFFTTTITLVMAILSEVQIEAGFGHANNLKYVWRILTDIDNPKEIYDLRYKDRL